MSSPLSCPRSLRRCALGLCAVALLLLTLGGSTAQAKGRLVVAYYAPELVVASQAHGFELATAMAAQLTKAGWNAEAKAYRRARDFERDAKAGRVQLALLGGSYIASTGRQRRILTVARGLAAGGVRWGILTKTKTNLGALKGKTLQVVRPGKLSLGAIQHALLDGQLDPRQHFKVRWAPSINSAIQAVRLGQAAAVYAPVGTAGLVEALGSVAAPPPAVVTLAALSKGEVRELRRTLVGSSLSVSRHYRGFGAKGGAHAAYRRRCSPRAWRFVLAPGRYRVLPLGSLVEGKQLEPPLAALGDLSLSPNLPKAVKGVAP